MKAAVVMGSDSDLPVVERSFKVLKEFRVDTEVRVISAHRTPGKAAEFGENAEKDGIDVIIAAAGKAAHLGGMIAAMTVVPVIGLPIKSSTLDGMDSLLSTVQMPKGIPVATVAIDGAENAALLAIQILSLKDETLKIKLKEYRKNMSEEINKKDKEISEKFI